MFRSSWKCAAAAKDFSSLDTTSCWSYLAIVSTWVPAMMYWCFDSMWCCGAAYSNCCNEGGCGTTDSWPRPSPRRDMTQGLSWMTLMNTYFSLHYSHGLTTLWDKFSHIFCNHFAIHLSFENFFKFSLKFTHAGFNLAGWVWSEKCLVLNIALSLPPQEKKLTWRCCSWRLSCLLRTSTLQTR